MKNTFYSFRIIAFLVISFLSASNISAQWGGNSLPLISGTNFKVSGGDLKYYNSLDEVDGWEGFILPNVKMTGNFAVVDTTNSNANLSHFLSESKGTGFSTKNFYGINNSSIKLDSLRLLEDDGWGMVISGGSKGLAYGDKIMSLTVGGLKPNGNYRVEVEYCAPTNKDFTNTQSDLNKKAKTTQRNNNEVGGLLGHVNCAATNYVDFGSKLSKSGECAKGVVSYTANQQTSGAIGEDGILTFDLAINSIAPHSALKIKSIKVYGELAIGIRGQAEVCAGGETSVLALTSTFNNVKYQWYKNNQAISGANNISYTHESGDEVKKKTTYYCEITTPNGDKIKSESFTVTDIECCSDKNGNPASQKLIWQDDFGTFTSATNYWVWDYSDISNPKKVSYTNGKKWQRPVVAGVVAPEDATFAIVGDDGDCDCPPKHASADNGKFGEGYYTIAGYVTSYGMNGGNNMGWVGYYGNGVEPSKNGFTYAPDHTYGGKDYGGMLYLNIGSDPDAVIYDRTIKGLCDRHITVKCYVNCFSKGTYPVKVYIQVTDLKSGVSRKSNSVTRYNNATAGTGWEVAQVSMDLTGTELRFQVFSEIGGNDKSQAGDPLKGANIDGNDLILDDIMIYACAEPSVGMFFDLPSHAKDSTTCDGSDVKLYVEETKMIQTNIGPDARYLYQYALQDPDDPSSWKTFAGPVKDIVYEDVASLISTLKPESGDKIYFRTVLGVESALDPNDEYNPNSPCGNYSVSERITLNIDCPVCTKPVDVIISPDLVVDPSNPYKKVQLCEGQKTILSTKEIKDSTGTYDKFRIQWHKESLTSSPISSVVGNKAKDLTVDWSDATPEGVKYYVKVYDDEFPTANSCYKFDSVIVVANPTPIQSDIVVEPFCENFAGWKDNFDLAMSVVQTSKYTIQWCKDDDCTTAGTSPNMDGIPAGLYDYYFTLLDKNSKCESEPVKVSFDIKANPLPLSTSLVQYLKSQENIPSVLVQSPNAITGVTDEVLWTTLTETDAKPSISDSLSATSTDPTPTIKDKVGTDDEVYYSWVYQRVEISPNVYCASEMSKVEIDILGAPAPDVTSVSYCVNDPSVESIGNRATFGSKSDPNKTYELLFYESETSTTPISEAKMPDVSVSGKTTYYVSQREVGTVNESKRVPFSIEVYDVADLKTANTIDLCKENKEFSLYAFPGTTSQYVKSESDFYWAEETDDINTSTQTVSPVGVSSTAGVLHYQVQPYFKLSSTQICRGVAQNIDVNIYETTAPSPATVQYIKADSEDGHLFPSITTKNTWKEESGYRYYYSSISETNDKPLSTYQLGAPSPQYDVNVLNGGTKLLYTWVYRVSDSNPIDCASDTIMITIKISDALPPLVKNVFVCEGSSVPLLQAEVQLLPNDNVHSVDDYELLWYGSVDPSVDVTATSVESGSTFNTGITNATVVNNAKTTYKYYVTQKDKGNGAESSSSEIVVTVLPKPVAVPKDVPAQCEGEVNLNNWYEVTNASECGSPLTPTYKDGNDKVESTGEYAFTVSYPLGYTSPDYIVNSVDQCVSEEAKIKVVIDKLDSVYIEGDTTVCPGGQVSLDAKIISATHDGTQCNYYWENEQFGSQTNSSWTNIYPMTFASENDKIYRFKMKATAGTCEKESEVHIVKVGNGQVRGLMTVTEADNSWRPISFTNDTVREFYSCGGAMTIDINYEKTEGDFKWTMNGADYQTGNSITIAETTASSDKTYEVLYVNKCDTKAKIIVHTIPLTVVPEISRDTLCEGESFTTRLDITCDETPDIQWYLNANPITNANNATYTKSSVLESEDDGQYSYKVTNRGCTREGDSRYLDVQRYMKVTDFTEPFIVNKNTDKTIELQIDVPEKSLGVEIDKIEWVEKGESKQSSSSSSYTETAVVSDHTYEISLTDNDYCSTSTTATIWVEADLQLKTDLKDTICLGSSAILTIDTTGTGAFRKKNVPHSLTVVRYMKGHTDDVTSELRKNGDLLEMEVSPTDSASYTITFTYDDQKVGPIVEIVNVIQAIDLTLPPVSTICEGDTIKLGVSDVTPEGTTVSWKPAETIISGIDTDTIIAVPTYTESLNHQFTYNYIVTATNKKCDESKDYIVPVKVDEALKGTPVGSEVICEGAQGKIDASSYQAATYEWTANEEFVSSSATALVNPVETTLYKVAMTRGVCTAKDSFEMEVTSLPVITSIDSVDIRDREIVMEPGKGTGVFYYWIDVESSKATDNTVYNLTFSKHVAYVRDENGCQTSKQFEVLPPPVIIPEFFTPNGDGVNDNWVVEVLRQVYPDAKVQIFDRFGKMMAEYLGGDSEGWDGTYKGNPMPSTDYWYVIDIEEIDRQYTGHFTLIRQ